MGQVKKFGLTPVGTLVLIATLVFLGILIFKHIRATTAFTCSDLTRKNIPVGDPQYYPSLDRDNDGIACER